MSKKFTDIESWSSYSLTEKWTPWHLTWKPETLFALTPASFTDRPGIQREGFRFNGLNIRPKNCPRY